MEIRTGKNTDTKRGESPTGLFRQPVLTQEEAAAIKKSIANAERKRTFTFHMKLVQSDGPLRQIEGYASTRDLDRTGEIVQPGAFTDSLKDFMTNPIVTYMHDWSNPIGKVVDARIDEVGLFIRAEVSETARKVWKLIEEGILRAFSIGYEVVEEKVVDGVNHILKLRLYEVAVVSIPANRRALFSVSKALKAGNDLVCLPVIESSSSNESRKMTVRDDTAFSEGSDDELTVVHVILREVMEKLSVRSHEAANEQ